MLEYLPFAGEPNADFRARIARRQAEAAEVRQRELLEQTSIINSPDLRIRIWERLHEITIPTAANHRLLGVIAAQTGLTIAQVQTEQYNRANPPAPPAADPAAAPGGTPPSGAARTTP
ncbi:MAG: hypothetical protein ACRES2_03305 [Steroidobacteraceae bacterium]